MCEILFSTPHIEQSLAKISKASKKFSMEHPEHYIKMGIKGSLINRELGLNGKPTRPELIMEAAFKKYLINFIPQQIFEIGIMDFFIPDGKKLPFV